MFPIWSGMATVCKIKFKCYDVMVRSVTRFKTAFWVQKLEGNLI